MNKVYIYNGSFSSLLTLVASLIYLNIKPDDIKSSENHPLNLLDEVIHLSLENKTNLYKSLKKNIAFNILQIIYYAFLSNDNKKELTIYYFIKNYLIYKNEVIYRRNLNCVNKILELSKYVRRETHKFKGFLRFKEMKNNFFYAEFAPTNNILPLLVKHFQKRFSNENFLICDTKRKIYAFYNDKKVFFLKEKDILKLDIVLSDTEKDIEELWITFFNTITIKERKNLKVQMNFMPKKYWDNIIEMSD